MTPIADGPGSSSGGGAFGVHVLAVLTGLMGIINVLSAATPSLASRLRILRQYAPLEVRHGGHLATALAGSALVRADSGDAFVWDYAKAVVGERLRRRRRLSQ